MLSEDHHELVGKILASGRRVVVAVTGGGSGAVSALVQTPGASRTVLEAVVPYSLSALVDWIGGKPDQACSEATARAMAMAAFMRAGWLAPKADPLSLVGIGFTGSLATDRVKRGERRIHLAAQTAERTEVHSIRLTDQMLDAVQRQNPRLARDADEAYSTTTLLWLIARSCGAPVAEFSGRSSDLWQGRVELAPRERGELILGARQFCVVKPDHAVDSSNQGNEPLPEVLFPGAFNPPHAGHFKMAATAEARLGRPIVWELSIANVDKPPLDFIAMRERVEALKKEDGARSIALTRAATFREKAVLFPKATFVVGVDTILRIAEPRYYGESLMLRNKAIAKIAERGCRFLVFGREMEGKFLALGDLDLPVELRRICDEVPATQFREDVSSTDLRKGAP
ncbi:MAG: CinA family protein [Pirellulales bacterium]|nr:CinA family protein [Pirellulales bacterium]